MERMAAGRRVRPRAGRPGIRWAASTMRRGASSGPRWAIPRCSPAPCRGGLDRQPGDRRRRGRWNGRGHPGARGRAAPEAGTGLLRAGREGPERARAGDVSRLDLRLPRQLTHDAGGHARTPTACAARWGGSRPGAGGDHDAGLEATTAHARGELLGFRVLRVETEVRKYSDVTLHLRRAGGGGLSGHARPATPRPWPSQRAALERGAVARFSALMEEAARRGVGVFSAAEARRRGVRWLDLARDPQPAPSSTPSPPSWAGRDTFRPR